MDHNAGKERYHPLSIYFFPLKVDAKTRCRRCCLWLELSMYSNSSDHAIFLASFNDLKMLVTILFSSISPLSLLVLTVSGLYVPITPTFSIRRRTYLNAGKAVLEPKPRRTSSHVPEPISISARDTRSSVLECLLKSLLIDS